MDGKSVEERVGVVLVDFNPQLVSERRPVRVMHDLGDRSDEHDLVLESLSSLITRIVLDKAVDENFLDGENLMGSGRTAVINELVVLRDGLPGEF